MPLYTEIIRDGEKRDLNWGWWHVERMQEVAILEGLGIGFEDAMELAIPLDSEFWVQFRDTDLALKGEQEVAGTWHFKDESDGELFDLLPGDILVMHR